MTLTTDVERVDVTTRKVDKPFKLTAGGLAAKTFECTVLADDQTIFTIGKAYSVTLNGNSIPDLVCMTATREEPQSGVITYKLTMRPGEESDTCDQVDVGPGTYRSCS